MAAARPARKQPAAAATSTVTVPTEASTKASSNDEAARQVKTTNNNRRVVHFLHTHQPQLWVKCKRLLTDFASCTDFLVNTFHIKIV